MGPRQWVMGWRLPITYNLSPMTYYLSVLNALCPLHNGLLTTNNGRFLSALAGQKVTSQLLPLESDNQGSYLF
jgi:hypothetical protein